MLYLGIHWFVDIIGGMVVAAMAVNQHKNGEYGGGMCGRRTINARLATVLTNPKRAVKVISESLQQEAVARYTRPTSETGVMLTVVMVVIAGVITWDLTHQSIPAGEVDAPVGVAAADGWLITLDEKDDGNLLLVHDLSNLEYNLEVVQPIMDTNSVYDIREIFTDGNNINVNILLTSTIEGIVETWNVSEPAEVEFISEDKFAVIPQGTISYWSLNGQSADGPEIPENEEIILFESVGGRNAFVFSGSSDTIQLGFEDSTEPNFSVNLNASAGEDEEQYLRRLVSMLTLQMRR